jgi:hypothetical protein
MGLLVWKWYQAHEFTASMKTSIGSISKHKKYDYVTYINCVHPLRGKHVRHNWDDHGDAGQRQCGQPTAV